MSRKADPETKGKESLDKVVARLTRQRRWQGDWELVDLTKRGREFSWSQFHDHPNTRIAAVARIVVKGQAWWIAATYESQATFADFVAFGLLGLAAAKNKLSLLVSSVDPRTDTKHSWDNDGNVRKYIKSRDDWRELNEG